MEPHRVFRAHRSIWRMELSVRALSVYHLPSGGWLHKRHARSLHRSVLYRLHCSHSCRNWTSSWRNIVRKALRESIRDTRVYWLTAFQVVNSFGACVSYMVLIAQTVPVVLGRWFGAKYGNQTIVTILVCTFILLPLCLYRDA